MNLKSTLTSGSYRVRVGLTIGDPSGIGPAIAAQAINRLKRKVDFTVIGDRWVFNKFIVHGSKYIDAKFIDLKNVDRKNFSFGKIKAEYGRASIEYLNKALELIKNEEIDCLVTGPISKESISLAGFNFPGHTEYLATQTNTKDFVMLLLNKELKIGLVTRHIPLQKVPQEISCDKIYKTILLTYNALREIFLIRAPRIAVCGLNPHASDNGLIGNEENRVIRPALEKVRTKLKSIAGPISSDVAILKTKQKEYDCVIAMYHDQALIALKLSGRESGVNMTLGLPFIRTSALHGTAFDIAGTKLANPSSLIEAINLAARCTQNLKKA